uniref:Uncharacterized protein n=1 Tax=Anguilla anguilla TaxID=7936 RepID=A0A0E9Y1I5_ANGAN
MSSATMTCWRPAQRGEWLKVTRPASAWRTHPVTTDTTGDSPAHHTLRD